jgi:hypothetical protein
MQHGPAAPLEFDVDEPIPAMSLPLRGSDRVQVELGTAYRKTFTEMAYGLEWVDYRALPPAFDPYSPADQARIACRMLAVLGGADAGVDLEAAAPLPVERLPLADALARLERWLRG